MKLGAAFLAELVEALESDRALAVRLRDALGLAAQHHPDELVGWREAGLSAREWRSACRSGQLVASLVGRRLVATRDEFDRYLASKRRSEPGKRKPRSAPSSVVDRAIASGQLRVVGGKPR